MLRAINGVDVNIAPHANLRGADLSDADLSDAALSGADLSGAALYDTDLRGADLRGADLRGADLFGANLRGANLRGANLRGANLRGADLSDADLSDADLSDADLRGADLRCMGNMREIKTLQIDTWRIGYTATHLQIGCQRHELEKWRRWRSPAGREWVAKMDRGALDWSERLLPLVLAIIDASPAVPSKPE